MKNLYNKIFTKLILLIIFRFFESLEKIDFVLIKKSSSFPYIKKGSDLDVLTTNLVLFENEINKFLPKYKLINLKTIHKSLDHYQFDIFLGKIFFIKLDIISSKFNMNGLKNCELFLEQTLSNKKIFTFRFFLKNFKVFIPSSFDEVIIRYLEFQKYPNKTHHKDYINSQKSYIFDEINKEYSQFLNKPIRRYS